MKLKKFLRVDTSTCEDIKDENGNIDATSVSSVVLLAAWYC